MTNKRPRKNTTFRRPDEFLDAIKKSPKEITSQELSWELKCDPQTTKRKLRELVDCGQVVERREGGTQRPLRFYSPAPIRLNTPLMEVEG